MLVSWSIYRPNLEKKKTTMIIKSVENGKAIYIYIHLLVTNLHSCLSWPYIYMLHFCLIIKSLSDSRFNIMLNVNEGLIRSKSKIDSVVV